MASQPSAQIILRCVRWVVLESGQQAVARVGGLTGLDIERERDCVYSQRVSQGEYGRDNRWY